LKWSNKMTVETIGTYMPRLTNAEEAPEAQIIDYEAMKKILYLGIKGEVHLPMEENHNVDTFA